MTSSSLRVMNLVVVLLGLGNARCGGSVGGDQVRNDAGHAEAGAGHAEAGAPVACNPLAPPPTTLGTIVGVGEGPAPATTIYVVSEAPDSGTGYGALRVFTASGQTLNRKFTDGTGSTSSTLDSAAFDDSLTEPFSDLRHVLIELDGGVATRMALAPSTSRGGFAPDAGDMPLALLDGAVVKGFAIKNLPNVITYVADASNGDSVVVVVAMVQETMADEHVFYGKPSQMVEVPLVSDNADCCEDILTFRVNGAKVVADLVFDPMNGDFVPSLQTATGTFGLKLRKPTPTNLDGFSFTCDGM